jgi:hypothetical protein
MKNMKKLIAMMLMMVSVFFIACEDDGESTLSPEDAKTELSTLNADMTGYLQEMANSKGMNAMDDIMALMQLDDPFASGKSTKTSVIPNIQKYLLPIYPEKTKSAYEAEPFDFEFWWGTYTWDAEHSIWSVVFDDPASTSDDKIVISFPTEGSTTNNAVLTLHEYEEVLVNGTDEYGYSYTDYMPTDILADLYFNEIKIVEIDLAATWITSGDEAGEPTSFDISVYLTPFTFSGSFDNTATAASIDFDIKYNTEQIFAAGVNATFLTDTEDPLTVGGYIQLLNVKIQATVDIAGMETVFESNTYTTVEEINTAINEEIDAVVLVDGVKAADIIIEFAAEDGAYSMPIEVEEGVNVYINVFFKYSDGTTEQAAPYFASFISGVQGLLQSFGFTDDGM